LLISNYFSHHFARAQSKPYRLDTFYLIYTINQNKNNYDMTNLAGHRYYCRNAITKGPQDLHLFYARCQRSIAIVILSVCYVRDP